MPVNESFYILDEDINGPVFTVAVGIELMLALVPNLFIVLYTLCHHKVLEQPSMIFLTGLALVSLLVTVLFLPFTVITAAAGEWIFGQTAEQKDGMCQFVGFVFSLTMTLTFHMLALLSIDRFLFITKPLVYRNYMRPWVAFALVVTAWILGILQNIAPFIGLGRNNYSGSVASCLPPLWNSLFLIYHTILTLVPVAIIAVTTLWMFCFTCTFLRQDKNLRLTSMTMSTHQVECNHIYSKKFCRLFGIFGMLMASLIASIVPLILAGVSVGLEHNIPSQVYAIAFVIYFASNIAYPTIQIYFRRDLCNAIVKGFRGIIIIRTSKANTKQDEWAATLI